MSHELGPGTPSRPHPRLPPRSARRALPGLLLPILAALLALGACRQVLGFDDTHVLDPDAAPDAQAVDAPPPRYRVRILAAGIITPVSLRLHDANANATELASVTADGVSMFTTTFTDGNAYDVQFVTGESDCGMVGNIGVVQGADAQVVLVCRMIDDIVLGGGATVPDVGFSIAAQRYHAPVSLLLEYVTVTAFASQPDIELTVAGQPVASGEPSPPIVLSLGPNPIIVRAAHAPSGAAVEYEIAVDRSAAVAQSAYGKASNTGGGDNFGWSVALSDSGDTLAVGAYYEDSAATGVNGPQGDDSAWESGAVYVFRRSDGVWVQEAYIKASNTGTSDIFGYSVALSGSGDTLAVGAIGEDSAATGVNGSQTDEISSSGAVYVFQRSGSTWAQQAYVKASNTGSGDQFGWSVALSDSGDTLAVGTPYEDSAATGVGGDQVSNSASSSGAVYVFQRSGGTWAQQAYVKASNTASGDYFGHSVALSGSGDTLAVGAYGEDSAATGVYGTQASNSAGNSGAVYVFQRTSNIWEQQAYVKASNTGSGDQFGRSVALSGSGDTLAVGAHYEDSAAAGVDGDPSDNSAGDSGAVYVFQRAGNTWAHQAYVKSSNPDASDVFGYRVALSASGDTLAVGAPQESSEATGVDGDQTSNGATYSGAVYLFQRSADGWAQAAYMKSSNTDVSDFFGHAVALSASGDTLAVSAYGEDSMATGVDGDQADNNASNSGAVYLFH